jgi:NAD(P)-dependent dehydrogenase (short-subunit alcohol dehydrogenase family)
MERDWQGRTAVITGAASGFGLEICRIAARARMNVVMADVQPDALAQAAREIEAQGAAVLAQRCDVAQAAEVDALAAATFERFGTPHFVFNNAGVALGGLAWEHGPKDWAWAVGVNLYGVANGVRAFTPAMLEAAGRDSRWRGHIVNTASMAGLLATPNMGLYNATKHAVVGFTETLYHDLGLVTTQLRAHLLCPYFVPTGIDRSERNRPTELAEPSAPTRSQRIAQAMTERAVAAGRVSAAQVAEAVFDAIDADRFYIFSHPHGLAPVQARFEDLVLGRNPSDPFKDRPALGAELRAALRGG